MLENAPLDVKHSFPKMINALLSSYHLGIERDNLPSRSVEPQKDKNLYNPCHKVYTSIWYVSSGKPQVINKIAHAIVSAFTSALLLDPSIKHPQLPMYYKFHFIAILPPSWAPILLFPSFLSGLLPFLLPACFPQRFQVEQVRCSLERKLVASQSHGTKLIEFFKHQQWHLSPLGRNIWSLHV